ncbi:MAG: ribosomal protein S18-alanine N-acetyltransferase [Anaerolineae bacterium]|nr:ribosomal protein S18-alanine N-acetyltransferase [Anaerolineae bacterium]
MSELTLRHMRATDVNPVVEIDTLSFDPAWPASSYYFEINKSACSHMTVLEQANGSSLSIARWWSNLRGKRLAGEIVGYGGLWRIKEEAHISTIAVHPSHRGHKFGELLLVAMLCRAQRLGAEYCVLEVRVSNAVAQALYKKYRFEIHGVKRKYYQNNEDAYDMRLEFTPEITQHLWEHYDSLCKDLGFVDSYVRTPHPRLGD